LSRRAVTGRSYWTGEFEHKRVSFSEASQSGRHHDRGAGQHDDLGSADIGRERGVRYAVA
jgi:hypothetical protein